MSHKKPRTAALTLKDGSQYSGFAFGSLSPISGEVVFNTGLVGYPESLTDPSYSGQILVLTYPLIGNYGVPDSKGDKLELLFESSRVQISGLIISHLSPDYSHWNAMESLSHWLKKNSVPGVYGVDTRSLTKRLREEGTMLGAISQDEVLTDYFDPDEHNMVGKVSCQKIETYGSGEKRVVLIDCGCKNNIIHSLVGRGVKVVRVPWNHDLSSIEYDGIFISNGPGNPKQATTTIQSLRAALTKKKPIFGICLGNQLLALAAGADTYKLKYGHRSQNQPCLEVGTKRCFITSQNHGYAIDGKSLPKGWKPWFVNANDQTIEGIRHETLPFMSVQFHPEARPGPTDTRHLFDQFVEKL